MTGAHRGVIISAIMKEGILKKPAKKPATPQPTPPETSQFTGRTHICFILDKSGSMSQQRDSAISGFNEYVRQQQELKDDTALTLVLFDTAVVTPFVTVPLGELRELTKHDYVPSGCTSLFDAVGQGIALTEPNVGKKDRAIVVILTDGLENSSKKITTREQIRDIIRMKEREGNWTFTYMGCGENWQREAAAMNIPVGNTAQLDPHNVAASMAFTSSSTRGLRASARMATRDFYHGTVPTQPSPIVHRTPNVTVNPFSQSANAVASSAASSALDDLIARSRNSV